MATERLYVETISDDALNITEDIVHLNNAMYSINQLSTSYVDKTRKHEVLSLLSTLERECRFYFRNVYLQGNTGKIYDSLRKRLKEDLRKKVISSMIKVGDETKQIIEALISVTDKMQAEKDGKNPHFRSDYMTLDGILNTVKPILKEAGIAIVQSVDTTEDDKIRCYTRLIHKSGEYLQGESVVHADKMTPQGFGSAITYARRYGITSLLSIAEPDDDGNAAEAATKAPAKKKSETVTSTKLPQDAIDKVVTAFNMSGIKEELLEKKYGVSSNWTTATRKEMLQAFDKLKAGEINSEFFLANK